MVQQGIISFSESPAVADCFLTIGLVLTVPQLHTSYSVSTEAGEERLERLETQLRSLVDRNEPLTSDNSHHNIIIIIHYLLSSILFLIHSN